MNRRDFLKLFPALAALHPALAVADDMDVQEALRLERPTTEGVFIWQASVSQAAGKIPNSVKLVNGDKIVAAMPVVLQGVVHTYDAGNCLFFGEKLIDINSLRVVSDHMTVVVLRAYNKVPKSIGDLVDGSMKQTNHVLIGGIDETA